MKQFVEAVLGVFGLMLVSTARADAETRLKSAREANEFLLKQVEDVERENADLLDRVRVEAASSLKLAVECSELSHELHKWKNGYNELRQATDQLVAKERLAKVSAKAKRMTEKETAK